MKSFRIYTRSTAVRILSVICLILLSISAVSCTKSGGVPDGMYSCIEADTGELYTFTGKKVSVTLFIMGNVTEHHIGTYSVSDGIITMDFPTDSYGIYSGTYSFSISEDGMLLTIGDDVFKRENSESTEESK